MAAATSAPLPSELELLASDRLLADALPAPIDTDSGDDALRAKMTDNNDNDHDLLNLKLTTGTANAGEGVPPEHIVAAHEQHVTPPPNSLSPTTPSSPPLMTHKSPTTSGQQRCLALPFELYRPIIENITSTRDLRTLAVCSRITQPDAERLLHHTVQAYGLRAVAQRCVFLARYPRVARMVRRVVFRERDEHSPHPHDLNNATGTTSAGREKSWSSAQPLPAFFRLVAAALRNTPNLTSLDASLLPTSSLPSSPSLPFQLTSFTHDGLVIGLDAISFFSSQPSIRDLRLNAFSYYELHSDDEHYRRLLYTILPNLRSLSCGLSVAIRLVRGRGMCHFVVPERPDCLDSDQLERVVRALCTGTNNTSPSSSSGSGGAGAGKNEDRLAPPSRRTSSIRNLNITSYSPASASASYSPATSSPLISFPSSVPSSSTPPQAMQAGGGLKSLIVERKFAGREGLQCIAKELRALEHLSVVLGLGSEWLKDLATLKNLRSLSLIADSNYFSPSSSSPREHAHAREHSHHSLEYAQGLRGPFGTTEALAGLAARASSVPSASVPSSPSSSSSHTPPSLSSSPSSSSSISTHQPSQSHAPSQLTASSSTTPPAPVPDPTRTALDELRGTCPALRTVYIRHNPSSPHVHSHTHAHAHPLAHLPIQHQHHVQTQQVQVITIDPTPTPEVEVEHETEHEHETETEAEHGHETVSLVQLLPLTEPQPLPSPSPSHASVPVVNTTDVGDTSSAPSTDSDEEEDGEGDVGDLLGALSLGSGSRSEPLPLPRAGTSQTSSLGGKGKGKRRTPAHSEEEEEAEDVHDVLPYHAPMLGPGPVVLADRWEYDYDYDSFDADSWTSYGYGHKFGGGHGGYGGEATATGPGAGWTYVGTVDMRAVAAALPTQFEAAVREEDGESW